jgi:hypothetical protein
MSELGQKRKSSVRANVFRRSADIGHRQPTCGSPSWKRGGRFHPIANIMRRSSNTITRQSRVLKRSACTDERTSRDIIASFAVAEIASAAEIKVMADTQLASALARIGDVSIAIPVTRSNLYLDSRLGHFRTWAPAASALLRKIRDVPKVPPLVAPKIVTKFHSSFIKT